MAILEGKRHFILLVVMLLTFCIFSSSFAASDKGTLNGTVTYGLSLDGASEEIIADMKKDGVHFINEENDRGIKLNPSLLVAVIQDKKGNEIKTAPVDVDGSFKFNNLQMGDYILLIKNEDTVFATDEIQLKKETIYSKTILQQLDHFLNNMHSKDDKFNDEHTHHGEDHTQHHEDGAGEIQPMSHIYPNLPCLDYNGNNTDGRHVHDWDHFSGSDCYWSYTVYLYTPACAFDHNNSLEICDGTWNCSVELGHSSYYHTH